VIVGRHQKLNTGEADSFSLLERLLAHRCKISGAFFDGPALGSETKRDDPSLVDRQYFSQPIEGTLTVDVPTIRSKNA
jgi:hypothetical protein